MNVQLPLVKLSVEFLREPLPNSSQAKPSVPSWLSLYNVMRAIGPQSGAILENTQSIQAHCSADSGDRRPSGRWL